MVDVEVEHRFQVHSQDLGGVKMERGFLKKEQQAWGIHNCIFPCELSIRSRCGCTRRCGTFYSNASGSSPAE